jgi:hypothetical protein
MFELLPVVDVKARVYPKTYCFVVAFEFERLINVDGLDEPPTVNPRAPSKFGSVLEETRTFAGRNESTRVTGPYKLGIRTCVLN